MTRSVKEVCCDFKPENDITFSEFRSRYLDSVLDNMQAKIPSSAILHRMYVQECMDIEDNLRMYRVGVVFMESEL